MINKTKRASNFELLRIIAIVLIVMQHLAYYSKFDYSSMSFFDNSYIYIMEIFGKLGVFLFVIITGFFYDKNKSNIKKYIFFDIKIVVYSLLCILAGVIIKDKISVEIIIKAFFPCCFSLYWFATCYLLLIIFAPYLNIIVERLDKAAYIRFLIILFFLISIIAYIPKTEVYFNNFFMFIFIYFIGAYIKKYDVSISNNIAMKVMIALVILSVAVALLFMVASYKLTILNKYLMFPFYLNSPLTVALGIITFLIFKNIKIDSNAINRISKNTFGIYLIHENPIVRNIIWNRFFNLSNYTGVNLIILSVIKICVIIFICILLSFLIDNFLLKKINIVVEKIINLVDRIYNLHIKNYIRDKKGSIADQTK